MNIILFYIIAILFITIFIVLLKDKNTLINIDLNKKTQTLIFIIFGTLVSASQVLLLNINYPNAGHDFSLIIPRAMSLLLFGEKNGIFATEWASPLFGAGLLSYANPQYYQYSPMYFLTFIMPFWCMYNTLAFLFTFIGFISIYFLLKDTFNFDFLTSLTGAVFFSCTGYFILHIRVGHWAFMYHPLTALIVWVFFSNRFNTLIKIIIPALVFSIMLYGGAAQTIFFYTCFVLLGIAAMTFTFDINFIKRCAIIITSVILSFILSISKIIPMVILGSKIDRGEISLKNVPIWEIFETFYYTFIVSPLSFLEHLFYVRGYATISYEDLWEKDIAFPFLLIPLAVIILIKYRKNIKENLSYFIKNNKIRLILFTVWFYLYCDMFYDKGIIRNIFPFLNKLNLHLRLSSVLIIPTIIIFCYLISKYKLSKKNTVLFFLVINIAVILFFTYRHAFIFIIDNEQKYSTIDIKPSFKAWREIKENYKDYYVDNIKSIPTYSNDMHAIYDFLKDDKNLSSLRFPYEPIYGYELQTFTAKEEGSPYKIKDGHYNFTHPNSLMFFSNEYPQFTGFSLEEKEDLDKFLHFEKVDWKLPKIFHYADMISIYSYIIVFLILIAYILYVIINAFRKYNKNRNV